MKRTNLLLLSIPLLLSLISCNGGIKESVSESSELSIESSIVSEEETTPVEESSIEESIPVEESIEESVLTEESIEESIPASEGESVEESVAISESEPHEEIDFTPVDTEIQRSYNYFMKYTNLTAGSNGFGLTQDRLTGTDYSSIAATGFLLGCYPVFVEQGLMKKDRAKEIVDGTLDTVLRIQADEDTSYAGMISHFVNKTNGKRYSSCEISTIDTAILVSGAICASEYFNDEDLINKANAVWGNVDYNKYIVTKNGRSYISMGMDDSINRNQLSGKWDQYAEQLMIYILGAGNPNPNHRLSSTLYKDFSKSKGTYNGITHIQSWFGSIFTYQYSHAFFNFKLYNDYQGVNYFTNSVLASQTSYQYCQDLAELYPTFSDSSWGLTACDTPEGYSGLLGAYPRGYTVASDVFDMYYRILGTIAPTGALGSMPFTPEESMRALQYYQSLPKLNDATYGLRDAFNLSYKGPNATKAKQWFCADYIGIDKGIAVMQMYNYKNPDFVSNLAMKNPYVIEGFLNNEFVEVN